MGRPYAMFWGCVIPHRMPHMELADRQVLPRLGIDFVDLPGASCCPEPIGVHGMAPDIWLALAARNLTLAEGMALDILTPCAGCFETLKTADVSLTREEGLRERVNDRLARIGRRYVGQLEVKHVVEVLYGSVGPERIAGLVRRPLEGLRVAVHYGCHLLRPSGILQVDDPEVPQSLDRLVEALGATSVDYPRRMFCCGVGVRSADRDASLAVAREKLLSMKRAHADCVAVVCPSCMSQFDLNQPLIARSYGDQYNLPVFYYSELLHLALGGSAETLGLRLHRVPVEALLESIPSGAMRR